MLLTYVLLIAAYLLEDLTQGLTLGIEQTTTGHLRDLLHLGLVGVAKQDRKGFDLLSLQGQILIVGAKTFLRGARVGPAVAHQHDGIVTLCILRLSLLHQVCLLYTSPSPRDRTRSRMPSSA